MGQLPCGHKLGKSNCGRGKTDVVARRPSCLPIVPSRKSGPVRPSRTRDTLKKTVAFTAPPDAPPKEEGRSRLSRGCRKLFKRKSGAGEGIRTLDPDLGKVVLNPSEHWDHACPVGRRPPGEFLDLLTVNGASQDRRAGPFGLSERFQPENPDRL